MAVLGSRFALLAALPAVVAGVPAEHATGSVVLTPEPSDGRDAAFLVPVQVGSQTLNMKLDLGSPYTWMYSTDLPESEIGDHTAYNTSGASKLNQTFSIEFDPGDKAGNITGNLYQDSVTVGDDITSPSQAIEAAKNINADFLSDHEYDGVLGFGLGSMFNTKPPHPTFYHNVHSSLEKPLFAIALKHDAPGTLDIGFVDESKYIGPLHTGRAGRANFAPWTFPATVNGTEMIGRIDTTSSLLLLDEDVVEDYYAQVPGSWHDEDGLTYEVPCDATLPDVNITIFDNYTAIVPGENINMGDRGSPRGLCFGGMQWNLGATQSSFGTVFLRSYYVLFETEPSYTLGFAQQAS